MKYIIICILLIVSTSCSSSKGKEYSLFDSVYKEYLLGVLNERDYIDKWVNVRSDKSKDFCSSDYLEFSKNIIQDVYSKSFFVGMVKLNRFKFQKFVKNDYERFIEEEVNIIETYKGHKNKSISYILSLEADDTYFGGKRGNEIIFLYKKDKVLYLDTLSTLEPCKSIIAILKNITKKTKTKVSDDNNNLK